MSAVSFKSDTTAIGRMADEQRAGQDWARKLPRCAADSLASGFLAGIEARGLSDNTLIAYGRAVEELIEFTGPLGSVRLNVDLIHRFLAFLRSPRPRKHGILASPLAPATMRQRLVGLRAYADYLVDAGLLDRNPVARGSIRRAWQGQIIGLRRGLVPLPRQMPRLPNDEEWARLIDALKRRPARDQLMFMLAYDGALRRSELVTLRLDDFDFSTRFVTIRPEHAKNGYGRTILYSPATGAALAAYLAERRRLHVGDPHLFLSASARNRSKRVGGFTWGLLAAALASEAGVSGFSTHTLRHLRLNRPGFPGGDLVCVTRRSACPQVRRSRRSRPRRGGRCQWVRAGGGC